MSCLKILFSLLINVAFQWKKKKQTQYLCFLLVCAIFKLFFFKTTVGHYPETLCFNSSLSLVELCFENKMNGERNSLFKASVFCF